MERKVMPNVIKPELVEWMLSRARHNAHPEYNPDFVRAARAYVVQVTYPQLQQLGEAIPSLFIPSSPRFLDRDLIASVLLPIAIERNPDISGAPSIREKGVAPALIDLETRDPAFREQYQKGGLEFLEYINRKWGVTFCDYLLCEFESIGDNCDTPAMAYFGDSTYTQFIDAIVTAFHMYQRTRERFNVSIAGNNSCLSDDGGRGALEAWLSSYPTRLRESVTHLNRRGLALAREALDRGDEMKNPPRERLIQLPDEGTPPYNILLEEAKTVKEEACSHVGLRYFRPLVSCNKLHHSDTLSRVVLAGSLRGGGEHLVKQLVVFEKETQRFSGISTDSSFDSFLIRNISHVVSGDFGGNYLDSYATWSPS